MKKSKMTSIRTKITLSLAATILVMVVMSCANHDLYQEVFLSQHGTDAAGYIQFLQ